MHHDLPTPRRVRIAEGVFKESGSFLAGYRCPITGKWTTKALKGVKTLTEAKKARRALLADLEARRATPSSRQTVSSLADEWLASREARVRARTFDTDRRYVALVKRYFGSKRVQDVEPRHVAAFLAALRAGTVGVSRRPMAEWTVVNSLKTLRAILQVAVLDGGVPFNPCERLQPHVKPKQQNRRQATLLTPDQVDALVEAAKKTTPSYAAVIATAAYTGARIREVLALRWCDIDHARGIVHLRGQVDTEGTTVVEPKTPESVRVSTLVPKLQPFLGREARMQARWSGDEDFVFSAMQGKPKDYANVRRALTTASAEAGLDRVRAHDLRHSYTSNLIPHTDLMTVARAVGHKNIAVTAKVYAHALGSPEQQAEKAALAAAAAGLGY
jgi:integrase